MRPRQAGERDPGDAVTTAAEDQQWYRDEARDDAEIHHTRSQRRKLPDAVAPTRKTAAQGAET